MRPDIGACQCPWTCMAISRHGADRQVTYVFFLLSTRSLLRVNLRVNTLRPRQNGRHFPDDIFKCIFLNENVWISIGISLKFAPMGPINNIPTLVQVMGWRRPGDKPLSEPMMVRLPTHICVTRPQWVNSDSWLIWLKNATHIRLGSQLMLLCTFS